MPNAAVVVGLLAAVAILAAPAVPRVLTERLLDVESAELERLQTAAAVDNAVVRRLQRNLDLQRQRENLRHRLPIAPTDK